MLPWLHCSCIIAHQPVEFPRKRLLKPWKQPSATFCTMNLWLRKNNADNSNFVLQAIMVRFCVVSWWPNICTVVSQTLKTRLRELDPAASIITQLIIHLSAENCIAWAAPKGMLELRRCWQLDYSDYTWKAAVNQASLALTETNCTMPCRTLKATKVGRPQKSIRYKAKYLLSWIEW